MKASPENIDEQIERYLLDQMDAAEQETFEVLLQEDPEVQERFEHHSNLKLMLEQEEGVSQLSNDIYDIFDEQNSTSSTRLYLQAAAFFLAAMGLVWLVNIFSAERSSEELALAYFEPFSDVVTSRAGTDSLVAIAMTAYNQRDYQRAIGFFNQLDKPKNSIYGLYAGISYFALQDYDRALDVFKLLEDDPPSNLRYTSKWYVALTSLVLDQVDDASSRLQELANTNSSFTQRANELLSELD